MMRRYFITALTAHLRGGGSLYLLTIFGVALGVAAVLSIQIINRNAIAAFAGSVKAVSGEADLSVLGYTPSFPEDLYPRVLATPGVRAAWPLWRAAVALSGDVMLDLIGVDFFTPVDIPWQGEPTDAAVALSQSGWVALTPLLAEQMGWRVGDAFTASRGSRRVRLTVGALVDFHALNPLASPKLAVMDIAQAQSLFGDAGAIHQIDVKLADGADTAAVRVRLQENLGPAVRVETPEQRETKARGLLSAFQLNLTALSLISLFVGVFLVYSSTQAALVRRREEFGLLRSLGATNRQVFALIMAEVGLLGGLGAALGLPLGYGVAQANVRLVSATLSNLYLLEEIARLEMTTWLYALGIAIGVGGAVVGALLPALDMARRDTRALLSAFTLHETVGSLAPRLFGLGVALPLTAAAWYGLHGRHWQHAGFVLAVVLLLALPLLTPLLVRELCVRIRVRGFGLGYSLKGLGVRLQTTSAAVASLAVAVSMLIGVTLMIGSFRQTLSVSIGTSIQADVYITPASWRGTGRDGGLEPDVMAVVARHPAVRAVDRLRRFHGYTGDRRIGISGVEMGLAQGHSRFPFLPGALPEPYQAVREHDGVFIGETLARKADVWVGDALPIYTPTGVRDFSVVAVYYDYSAGDGAVAMDLRTLAQAFGPGPVNSTALYLRPGADAASVVAELQEALSDRPLEVRSNRRLREEVMAIFDQTFAVTRLLQLMSLLIAVCGIALMLLVMAREQASELAVCRSLGARGRQLFGVFVGKGLSMGVMGLVLGSVGGVLLAGLLICVINRTYFGWTIQPYADWGLIARQAATILAAAVLASLYPAFRARQTSAAALSRDDL
jgi:putative ABC transport system permease protein